MVTLPDEIKAVLDEPVFVHLATVDPHGFPHNTAMWVERQGDRIAFCTVEGRVKHRNVLANPKVSVSFVDPNNSYRAFMIQGEVVEVTRDDADPMINRMARRYLGTDYEWAQPGEVRTVLMVEPTNVARR